MAQGLAEFSDALAATVAAAGPIVARVEARPRLPASGIIWSPEGVIVTAHHVLEREEELSVGLPDGRTVPAALVGRDPSTDLAVVRAQATGLTPATWAPAEALRVGHLVLAIGRPGRSVAATLGIVSALGESWRTPAGGRLDRYLQTDVVMYPGFSGGPLVEAKGQVIGLSTSALLRGVSLAVPAATIRRVVEAILAHGRVRRSYLGIGAQGVRLPAPLAQQLGQETGLMLVSIEAAGPAERGGLLLGDILVAVGGKPVRHLDDLLSALSSEPIEAETRARIVRGGESKELVLVIGERS